MTEEKLLVWPGERRLLPSVPASQALLLRCADGKAYLRIMSQSSRRLIKAGETAVIGHGEIATLSGIEITMVNVKFIDVTENHIDC